MTDRDLLAECGRLRFRVAELERERGKVRDEALEMAAQTGYVACAETRHVTLGDKVRAAILAIKEVKP